MPGGRFITLEGTEGAGKSTNVEVARRCLRAMDIEVVVTREPGGTPLAEEIRRLLLSTIEETVDPLAETLLMFAARAQHLAKVIKPCLAEGRWVLCERFTDATHAYQGGGRGVDAALIDALAALVHPDLEPDLTLYLDVPVGQAFARISARPLDRFERERRAFFERVRARYLELSRGNARVCVIDAAASPAEVAAAIETRLRAFRDAS